MSDEQPKIYIKDLSQITNVAEVAGKYFEVEGTSASGQPFNRKVSSGILFQWLIENFPGANNNKSLYKTVRHYSRTTPGWAAGSPVLADLNQQTLALWAICFVEFNDDGRQGVEYRLIYDPQGPLEVWRDGTFSGGKIRARWVERGSLAESAAAVAFFTPTKEDGYYGPADPSGRPQSVVRYTIGEGTNFYRAKRRLTRTSSTLLPAPTGQADDANWELAAPPAPAVYQPYRRIPQSQFVAMANGYGLLTGQIVEIYDRTDGQPAVRVLCNDIISAAYDLAWVRDDAATDFAAIWQPCTYDPVADTTGPRSSGGGGKAKVLPFGPTVATGDANQVFPLPQPTKELRAITIRLADAQGAWPVYCVTEDMVTITSDGLGFTFLPDFAQAANSTVRGICFGAAAAPDTENTYTATYDTTAKTDALTGLYEDIAALTNLINDLPDNA